LVLLLLAATSVFYGKTAQQAPQQPPLQYEVAVTLKLVQVYVTDKSGNPVRDLTKDDFAVLDNGRPVTVTEFEKHDLTPAPPGAEAPSLETKPAAAASVPQAAGRKFLVLFDFAFNTQKGVAASIMAALHFLDTEVKPGDELAFLSYSMLKGLKIHEFLTTDHAKVKKVLSAVTTKEISGRADEVEQAYWMLVEMGQSNNDMEMQRQDSTRQAQKYLLDLTTLAQALRLVQGQKSVLFFSNGIPSSLVNSSRGAGTGSYISQGSLGSAGGAGGTSPSKGSTFEVGNSVLRPLQEKMLKEFSASNCAFYAFDTRESSKIPSLFAYDELAFAGVIGGGIKSADGVSSSVTSQFRNEKTTGADSLRGLSKQTGGKYYSNIGLYKKNLGEVSAVTGTYYVLGYSISAAADGKFHDVKVEVKRKGCQVRAQRGYFNPKPFREYTDLEKSLHLFDLALNERSELQIPKPLSVSALTYDGGQGTRVRALARIPAEVRAGFGGKEAELVALFFDEQDGLLSLQRATVSIAAYHGKDLLFTAGAPARAGLAKCRVVVRDLETGQSAVGSTKTYVGGSGNKALCAYSPLVVVKGGGLFRLEGVVKGSSESPSWQEIYPYDAAAFSPVIGGETVRSGKIGLIVPYSASGVGGPDVVFKANLVNSATGENLPVPFELRESSKQGTLGIQNLELALDDVPPGTYLLYIHVADRRSGATATAYVPLTIGR
jgi:VWFA-related protein